MDVLQSLETRALVEMRKRTALLPEDLQQWVQMAEDNTAGLGIHRSQYRALRDQVMDVLLAQQKTLLDQLTPDQQPEQFSKSYVQLLALLSGIFGVWRIFRYIIAQAQDSHFSSMVDLANLVAADCYLTCMKEARNLGVVTESQFREPPMVYLDNGTSPATASRNYRLTSLGFSLDQYTNLRTPIPIIIVPFDQATCAWLICTIHHEVGHNIDQDLALKDEFDTLLKNLRIDPGRLQNWRLWNSETLADAFGVLLGGSGFAFVMASLLLPIAPQSPDINSEDIHAHPFVRIPLICSMLKQCGVQSLSDDADKVMAIWSKYQDLVPDDTNKYLNDVDTIAKLYITKPLQALKKKPLSRLVPDLNGDVDLAGKLGRFLRTGQSTPDPANFPYRLVPVAAQLAFAQAGSDPGVADDIQKRALDFNALITRPTFLAAAPSNEDLLRKLSKDLALAMEALG